MSVDRTSGFGKSEEDETNDRRRRATPAVSHAPQRRVGKAAVVQPPPSALIRDACSHPSSHTPAAVTSFARAGLWL